MGVGKGNVKVVKINTPHFCRGQTAAANGVSNIRVASAYESASLRRNDNSPPNM